ncbi:hypothetical protein [Flavobacterium sp.]|uniref:tetratricopeptide repeat protein n=1 Tax=Flavobacterium sp. TaxID=239 RepID=UPI00286DCBF4|nr:hypothetical protein [Flavobacterium sp.]
MKYSKLFILLFITHVIYSQTYSIKKTFNQSDKKDFLGMTKRIFGMNNELSYNISSNDITKSFTEMSSNTNYDENYLKKINSNLKKDSLNALVINDFGNYYRSKGNTALAKEYFTKSYNNLSIKHFAKDSAFYYSFRGVLKMNLEKEDAISDIEKSLKINPNDSIAMVFYPMLLIQKGEFEKSKKLCINSLENEGKMTSFAFLMLNMTVFFEKFQFLMTENLDITKRLKNKNTHYDQLIDYKIIDKYYAQYGSKPEIKNIRKMSDILGLMLKFSTFESAKNDEVILEYNNYEISKIKNLENYFLNGLTKKTLNKYSAYKSLGFTNFLLKNNKQAIEYYKKAIQIFPSSKKTSDFNLTEAYNMLITLYGLEKDDLNFKKILEEKIKIQELDVKYSNDYLKLAKCHLYEKHYDNAEEWCNKARAIEPNNHKTLQLLAHLNYINGNLFLGQHYINDAMKNAFNDDDNYNIIMQFAVYNILDNKPNEVIQNFETARKLLGNKKCNLCDELMADYINIKN